MKLNLSARPGALLAAALLRASAAAARAQTPDAAAAGSHLLVLNMADSTPAITEPDTLKIPGKVTVGECARLLLTTNEEARAKARRGCKLHRAG